MARRSRCDNDPGKPIGPWPKALEWHSSRNARSVHQTPFRQLIVANCKMHRGGVVPHQEVADLPFVPVLEFRLKAVRMQFFDQGGALVVRQTLDPDALASGDVERLAPARGCVRTMGCATSGVSSSCIFVSLGLGLFVMRLCAQ